VKDKIINARDQFIFICIVIAKQTIIYFKK